MNLNDIIILKREPGPVAGMLAVTIDAPDYKQATFIVSEAIKDTIEEKMVLAKMMATRNEASEASREGQI